MARVGRQVDPGLSDRYWIDRFAVKFCDLTEADVVPWDALVDMARDVAIAVVNARHAFASPEEAAEIAHGDGDHPFAGEWE